MSEQEIKRKANGCTFIIVLLIIAGIAVAVQSCNKMMSSPSPKPTNLEYNEMTTDMKLSVMTYVQTVLDEYMYSPKYSRSIDDYSFVRTGDRYKVEGRVSGQRFTAIITWDYVEDKYFTLETLEIGGVKYK